ncbi:MAG TPA: O-acetylhomoserine/O-acetylserine sulfhydrylase, partial [Rhodospirillaceae bacterium]|nr:O-acetylhomoserine/O-acetylserine sulfhydrylase [Rhodospirillaceae bacterium]
SRLTNPTVSVLEERIASLENGIGATCTASGHAAQMMTLSALMRPGDRFISSTRLYGGSLNQFKNTFPRSFGWHCDFVDFDDLEALRKTITPEHKAIFCESLANPGGVITDLEAIAAIAEEFNIPLIVDNTM